MKTIPLRDFQREGVKALGIETLGVDASTEPWILAGREQEFLVLPVSPENRTAIFDLAEGLAAVMSLRQDQARAVEAGLNRLTMDEIEIEIGAARKAAKRRKRTA